MNSVFNLDSLRYDYNSHCHFIQHDVFLLALNFVPKTDRSHVSAFAMSITKGNETKVIWDGIDTATVDVLSAATDIVSKIQKSIEYKKAYQI